MVLPAGARRHHLTVEKRVQEQGEDGHVSYAWVPGESVFGLVRELSAQKLVEGRAFHERVRLSVTIPFVGDPPVSSLSTDDRFDFHGRKLQIRGIVADERFREQECFCSEERG